MIYMACKVISTPPCEGSMLDQPLPLIVAILEEHAKSQANLASAILGALHG